MKLRALVAAGLLLGCQAPGIPQAELPSAPIAIAYRSPELARQRAKYLASLDPERVRRYQEERWRQFGLVPVDELRSALEGWLGVEPSDDRDRYRARLALLYPDTGRIEVMRSALRGSRPQAWSPDRSRLVFSQPDGDSLQLYEYDFESESVHPLTRGPGVHARGCYGPDGRLVVMTASIEDRRVVTRIALTDAGGLNPEFLSPGPHDHSPSCAPDGGSVAYVAASGRGRDRLFSVAPEGRGPPRRLGPGREPSFAPDGWLLFSARVAGQWQLWRIRPDGTGRARVGEGVLDEGHPAVSPDGRYVAYVVGQDQRRYLNLRRIDGSGDRILFRNGDAEFPVW